VLLLLFLLSLSPFLHSSEFKVNRSVVLVRCRQLFCCNCMLSLPVAVVVFVLPVVVVSAALPVVVVVIDIERMNFLLRYPLIFMSPSLSC